MPLAVYLPNPDKWINTASPSASSSRSKQRPLVAFQHGFPTPPTTDPRSRSRATSSSLTRTDENAPKANAKAGPSRLRGDETRPAKGGLSGFFTPPATASSKGRAGRIRREEDGASVRGSPVSRSNASKSLKQGGHPGGLPLFSRPAYHGDDMDFVSPEDEKEEEQLLPALAGTSTSSSTYSYRPSPVKSSGITLKSPATNRPGPPVPNVSKMAKASKLINHFSSSDLSELPSGYGTDKDDEDIPVAVPRPTLPAPTIPPSLPRPKAQPLRQHATTIPIAFSSSVDTVDDPSRPPLATQRSSSTPPESSPRISTQPPRHILASHWRMNGMSSEAIGQGEEPWGKSIGYIENERRREKASEKSKLRKCQTELQLEIEVDRAKDAVDRVAKVKKYLMSEDTDQEDEGLEKENAAEPISKHVEKLRRSTRPPLSPVRVNVDRDIRTTAPGSPTHTPIKKIGKSLAVAAEAEITPGNRKQHDRRAGLTKVVSVDRPEDEGVLIGRRGSYSATKRGRPITAATEKHNSRSRSRSASVKPRNVRHRLEDHLASVMNAAKRDAEERDAAEAEAQARLDSPIVRPDSPPSIEHHQRPDKDKGRSRGNHHNITPPKKKRRYTDKEAETLFDFQAPPQPDFSSSPRGSQESKDFQPIEVVETLMTWSLGGGAVGTGVQAAVGMGDTHDGQPEQRRSSDISADDVQAAEANLPTQNQGAVVGVDSQSIPATVASESFPILLHSQPQQEAQSHLRRPTARQSGNSWTSLHHGILSVPITAPIPSDTSVKDSSRITTSTGSKKRKSLTGDGHGRASQADRPEKQSKLEAFGIVSKKPERRVRDFDMSFEDEADIEEEPDDDHGEEEVEDHGEKAGAGKTANAVSRQQSKGRGRDGVVPDAPLHPDYQPAGIKAIRARDRDEGNRRAAVTTASTSTREDQVNPAYDRDEQHEAASTSRDRSSPPLFSPPRQGQLALPRSESDAITQRGDTAPSTPSALHHSPYSSSLMTDTTDEQDMPNIDPDLQKWWDGLGSQSRG